MSHKHFDAARQAAQTKSTAALLALAAQHFDPADDVETTLSKIEVLARYLYNADPRGLRQSHGAKEAAATYVEWVCGIARTCHRGRAG
ncbi:MAG: hypothetical protein GTN69_03165 [Armatimonadetes bacterium]|nr:hypothetical protein [Armatimonadota bacterium]